MRVLLRRAPAGGIGTLDDVRSEASLLEIVDFVQARPHLTEGKLSRMLEAPTPRNRALIETLASLLDQFGDVPAAAAAMHIHTNTVRYRLARVGELTGLNLANPSERVIAQLQLAAAATADQPALGDDYEECPK